MRWSFSRKKPSGQAPMKDASTETSVSILALQQRIDELEEALSCKVQQCDEMTQRSDAERDRMREEVILAQAQLADERQAQDAICTRLSDQLAKQNIAIVKLRYMMIDRDSALARKDKELAALRDQVVTITAAHAIEKAALQTAHAVALDSMVADHKAERAQLRGTVANLKALLKQERREKDTECGKMRDQLALMKTLMRNAMEDAVKILPSVVVDKVAPVKAVCLAEKPADSPPVSAPITPTASVEPPSPASLSPQTSTPMSSQPASPPPEPCRPSTCNPAIPTTPATPAARDMRLPATPTTPTERSPTSSATGIFTAAPATDSTEASTSNMATGKAEYKAFQRQMMDMVLQDGALHSEENACKAQLSQLGDRLKEHRRACRAMGITENDKQDMEATEDKCKALRVHIREVQDTRRALQEQMSALKAQHGDCV